MKSDKSKNLVVRLHPLDDVLIACRQLVEGMQIADGVIVRGLIPAGHKVAAKRIKQGEPVRRYGQIIGVAARDISVGEHVHTHNLAIGSFTRDYIFSGEPISVPAVTKQAGFMGIVRSDGRVATRNYVGILSTVNCSATVARAIADHFRRDIHPQELASFPNVDGVIALTHSLGCAVDSEGEGLAVIRRTLGGYARHPNFAAVLMIGLGCETNQIDGSHLTIGLQCGGSDGYSGITANPALGAAVDLLVAHGGTAILSETPEIYGAEHLLTRRAASREIGEKLIERVRWWEAYCARMNATMNNNPSAGNKAGGLTTILEKSLGAVAKGGTTNLMDVYNYAELVRSHGLVFMDTPGYDPVSATGQVAGGANLICFTTGRGSAYGCAPVPSLKLSTNTALWQRQSDDVDLDCGAILDGARTIEELGAEIFDLILATASGRSTKSELHGYGQNEFVPWQIGAIL
jgi:altronate hydrolase